MAGALGTSLYLLQTFTSISRKNLSPKSSLSASHQRKFTKRKNHLRPKILKTLTKPHPNSPIPIPIESPPTNLVIPVESPSEQISTFPSGEVSSEEPKELEIQEVQLAEVSEPRIVSSGKSFALKFLLWLVAAFVIPYVWVSRLDDFDSKNGNFGRKDEKDEILEIGVNGKNKSKLKLLLNGYENGGIALVDEAEMERKIEEIQVMAREAREKEKIEAAKSSVSDYDDDEDSDSLISNAIGKEVEDRLLMLRKLLKNASGKPPASSVRGNGEMKDTALLFKKKHKFRDFSGKPSDKPNGFGGPLTPHGEERRKGRPVQTSEQGKPSLEKREENSREEQDFAKSEHRTGVAQDGSNQVMMVEAPNNNEPSTPETTVISNKENKSNRNLSSKRKKATEKQLAKKSGSTNSEKETDLWWMSLPYILVVRMHGEGTQGLYCLKSGSDDSSLTVAFEDHGDAANFCYILQSYFEDLEDFRAEIVFLSKNEHKKSIMKNLVVVRKGQLKLYAGQPLCDVEMALHSLAAQS